MTKHLFLFLCLIGLTSICQAQIVVVKLDGDPITPNYTYPYFFCPSMITIEDTRFDSLTFEDAKVSYTDLLTGELTTVSFASGIIDMNPTGKLTAQYSHKENQIKLELGKASGFKNGVKQKIKPKHTEYLIRYGESLFMDKAMFNKINSRSKIKLTIDGVEVTDMSITLSDTSKNWKIETPPNTRISHGMLILIKVPGKAPRPFGTAKFNSEEEFYVVLKQEIKRLVKDDVLNFNQVFLETLDGKEITKAEVLLFQMKE